MISMQLREEYAVVAEVIADNLDLVKNIYDECLTSCLTEDIAPEESHMVFCTLTGICLIYDYDTMKFPLNYEVEDEELLAEVVSAVDVLLTVEAMADKDILQRKLVDGKTYYSTKEK